ncbi:MAG: DUF6106 family protein [Lachnospiraceae bacterium]|nr:DUF6106 family protein [Lachnospiraceae bacterium]
MSEAIKELLICQKQSFMDRLPGYAMVALTLISVPVTFIFGPLVLVATIVFGILSYVLFFRRMTVEYEYTYMDKELTIDRIYNQSSRKTVEVLDLNKMEVLARENSRFLDSYKGREVKTIDYSTKSPEDDEFDSLATYVMYYEGQRKYRFSFNEETFEFMRRAMPHKIKND